MEFYTDFGSFDEILSAAIISIELHNFENIQEAESLVWERTGEFWLGED